MSDHAGSKTIHVEVPADVLIASDDADLASRESGFSDLERAELRLAVRELATNLIKHAGGGTMTVVADGERVTVEAIDSGPGIANVDMALTDGFSTVGSLGYGLGTVNRVMDEVTVTSGLGRGTSVRAHRSHRPVAPAVACPLDIGVATMPKPGFTENGDGYIVRSWDSRVLVGVLDGVGHGAPAQAASLAARNYIESHADQPFEAIFRGVAIACRGTRGVVMALARLDWKDWSLEFASVGNIEVRVLGSSQPIRFVVRRGILGVNAPEPKIATVSWPAEATLVLHSDGVASHWNDDSTDAISGLSATASARELLVRHGKQMDDATVLVLKLEE